MITMNKEVEKHEKLEKINRELKEEVKKYIDLLVAEELNPPPKVVEELQNNITRLYFESLTLDTGITYAGIEKQLTIVLVLGYYTNIAKTKVWRKQADDKERARQERIRRKTAEKMQQIEREHFEDVPYYY